MPLAIGDNVPFPLFSRLMLSRILNVGSPYNVSAGSQADLRPAAAHYENLNKNTEEKRVSRLKDGKVVSVYD